jgi:hypothetical protein
VLYTLMLDQAGTSSYEARQAYRETLDLELEAPVVDPADEQSVSERVRYERDRRRKSPEALEQQRRQEAQLDHLTL